MSENQKKIWITGASSGIGKAVAEKFANEGWKVAVSARRKEILDSMANNQNITSFPLNVVNKEDCINVFESIVSKFNTVDLCIFCSGTFRNIPEHLQLIVYTGLSFLNIYIFLP